EVSADLDAHALLEALHAIENELGRVRAVKDGPRTIDLDLLLYGDEKVDEPNLTVPHPRMRERAFVVVPLLELGAADALPNGRRLEPVADAAQAVRRFADPIDPGED